MRMMRRARCARSRKVRLSCACRARARTAQFAAAPAAPSPIAGNYTSARGRAREPRPKRACAACIRAARGRGSIRERPRRGSSCRHRRPMPYRARRGERVGPSRHVTCRCHVGRRSRTPGTQRAAVRASPMTLLLLLTMSMKTTTMLLRLHVLPPAVAVVVLCAARCCCAHVMARDIMHGGPSRRARMTEGRGRRAAREIRRQFRRCIFHGGISARDEASTGRGRPPTAQGAACEMAAPSIGAALVDTAWRARRRRRRPRYRDRANGRARARATSCLRACRVQR